MAHVVRCEPETIDQLKTVVEGFARNMDEASLRKIARHTRRRAELCRSVGAATSSTFSKLTADTYDWLCAPDEMTHHVYSMAVFHVTVQLNTCVKLTIVFVSLPRDHPVP